MSRKSRHSERGSALDSTGLPTRTRLDATVVRLEHEGSAHSPHLVIITDAVGGLLFRVRARSVGGDRKTVAGKYAGRDLTSPNDFRVRPTAEHCSQVRPAISNRNPKERARIRHWWHDGHGSCGRLVCDNYL